jgi:HPt (histidine-containing phosphotransfer) domain-containing protein
LNQILKKFRDSTGEHFEHQSAQALATDDCTKARRLAHSLKGTALTVAAEGVAQAAAVLEQVAPNRTRRAVVSRSAPSSLPAQTGLEPA